MKWKTIDSVPHDAPVLLANFQNKCLMTGSPHVWAATYVTKWDVKNGKEMEDTPMWCEASFAAMNKDGDPTHWAEMPDTPAE